MENMQLFIQNQIYPINDKLQEYEYPDKIPLSVMWRQWYAQPQTH